MSTQCLAAETAFVAALAIIEEIQFVFRPEERRDAFEVIYERCRAAMEAVLILQNRARISATPSWN